MKPGDIIDGKYQIEVELGEGGMGRVLAASHTTIGSTVAIKVLKAEALKHAEVPRRFMREARAAGRLRSEHVVRVSDVGQLPSGEPYMVMEMLHGIDLSTRLKQGPVPPPLAVEYIVQACEGLAEAHAMGMVHRDVKPANLFVTKKPNGSPLIKLLDFGIATAATGDIDHNLTSTLTVIGSPSYMSPEQLRAARDVDARSDIWSLGVTLYELLTGEQPFIGPTLTALTLKIVGEPHAAIPGIPPALSAVVDRCLEKHREQRYANVAELADALAPFSPNGRIAAEMVAGSLSQPVPPTLLGMDSSAKLGVQPTIYPSRSEPTVRPPTSTSDLTAGESAPVRPARRGAWIAVGTVMAAAIVVTAVVVTSTNKVSNAGEVSEPSAAGDGKAGKMGDAKAGDPSAAVRSGDPVGDPVDPKAVDAAADRKAVDPGSSDGAGDRKAGDRKAVDATTGRATARDAKARDAGAPAAKPGDARPGSTAVDAKAGGKVAGAKADPLVSKDQRPKKRPIKRPAKDPRAPVEPTEYSVRPGGGAVRPGPAKEPITDPTRYPVNDPTPPVRDPKKVPCAPNDPRCGL